MQGAEPYRCALSLENKVLNRTLPTDKDGKSSQCRLSRNEKELLNPPQRLGWVPSVKVSLSMPLCETVVAPDRAS